MGGDGGSLPTRGDLVKEKEKEEKANPQEQERSRWTTCRLSAKPLGDDVVTCKFGMLYNRSEAVQYMADVRSGKRAHVAAFAHLNTLKDLVPLRPKRIDGAAPDAFPRWQCPITVHEQLSSSSVLRPPIVSYRARLTLNRLVSSSSAMFFMLTLVISFSRPTASTPSAQAAHVDA